MKIHINAQIYINSQNQKEAFNLIKKLIKLSKSEEGCIEYVFAKDQNMEDKFLFIEIWKSKKHLENHFNTKHFKNLIPQILKLSYKQENINIYEQIY